MSIESILEEIRARLEERIKRQISGLGGFVMRPLFNSMMPLHVEGSLAPEIFELVFLEDGIVELRRGSSSNVDVRIESDPATIISLYQSPSTELLNQLERQGKIRISSLTRKGKDAEGYIRSYLAG